MVVENQDSFQNISELPVIEVSGNPHELGFELGKKCKNLIREHIKKVYAIVTQYSPSISKKEDFIKLNRKFIPPAEEFAPVSTISLASPFKGCSDQYPILLSTTLRSGLPAR